MRTAMLDKEEGRIVTADKRGRIVLGADASTRTFTLKQTPSGDYVLTPVVIVPAREAWLSYENESRASFERGLADITTGRVREVDYSQYLTAEDRLEAQEAATE